MGMLMVQPLFAESIIEKYSAFESYYVDSDSLVFYKEGLGNASGASSSYYTELTLKLLLMYRNYEQSGQQLSVNWNLLNQTVMKTALRMSAQVERSLQRALGQRLISGRVGAAGQTGAIGSTGASGPVGVLGHTGATGQAGMDGYNRMDGRNGTDGQNGNNGQTGIGGQMGIGGRNGSNGISGNNGINQINQINQNNENNSRQELVGRINHSNDFIFARMFGLNRSFSQVRKMEAGIPGGEIRVTGAAGIPGATGASGAVGRDGVLGNAGAAGTTGALESASVPGRAGDSGRTGASGGAGDPGTTGGTGTAGTPGAAGRAGAIGEAGSIGITGRTGIPGAAGEIGSAGLSGALGLADLAAFSAMLEAPELPQLREWFETLNESEASIVFHRLTEVKGIRTLEREFLKETEKESEVSRERLLHLIEAKPELTTLLIQKMNENRFQGLMRRRTGVSFAARPRLLGSIGSEKIRLRLLRMREQDLQEEQVREWFELLTEPEAVKVMTRLAGQLTRLTDLTNQTNPMTRSDVSGASSIGYEEWSDERLLVLKETLKGESNESARERLIRLVEREPQQILRLVRESLGGAGEAAGADAVKAETKEAFLRLFQKYEERIFQRASVRKQTEYLRREEERSLRLGIVSVLETVSIRPEEARRAGKELARLLEEAAAEHPGFWKQPEAITAFSETLVMTYRENPGELTKLLELVHQADGAQREQIRHWVMEYGKQEELRPLSAPERQQRMLTSQKTAYPLFHQLTSILEGRFTEPGAAKQAEKELFQILSEDFTLEERELILRTEEHHQTEETEDSGSRRTGQGQLRTLLQQKDTVKLLQEKVLHSEGTQLEKLRDWVRRYQLVLSKETERTQLETVRKQTAKSSTELFLRFLRSDRRLEQEKRELVTEVRRQFGAEEASQLEHFLGEQNQVTGQVLESRMEFRADETVRRLLRSYQVVEQKRDVLHRVDGESEQPLENRLRESVHEPGSNSIQEERRRLEVVRTLIRRNLTDSQQQTRFVRLVRQRIELQTAERVLRAGGIRKTEEFRRTGGMLKMAKQTGSGLGDLFEKGNLMESSLQRSIALLNPRALLPEEKTQEEPEPLPYVKPSEPERIQEVLRTPLQGRNPGVSGAALSSLQSAWGETQTEVFRRQSRQETDLEETKTVVKKLNEKLEIQEKLVAELKKKAGEPGVPSPINVSQLTRQIMKKMESELRTEKMRRGLL